MFKLFGVHNMSLPITVNNTHQTLSLTFCNKQPINIWFIFVTLLWLITACFDMGSLYCRMLCYQQRPPSLHWHQCHRCLQCHQYLCPMHPLLVVELLGWLISCLCLYHLLQTLLPRHQQQTPSQTLMVSSNKYVTLGFPSDFLQLSFPLWWVMTFPLSFTADASLSISFNKKVKKSHSLAP